VPEPASGRFVTVTRATDGARLYLCAISSDAWRIANVVGAGLSADPHLGCLTGHVREGRVVLRWAGGTLPSAARLDLPLPASPTTD
jgi:hypothetical protein